MFKWVTCDVMEDFGDVKGFACGPRNLWKDLMIVDMLWEFLSNTSSDLYNRLIVQSRG
jgi:hypothetical protein